MYSSEKRNQLRSKLFFKNVSKICLFPCLRERRKGYTKLEQIQNTNSSAKMEICVSDYCEAVHISVECNGVNIHSTFNYSSQLFICSVEALQNEGWNGLKIVTAVVDFAIIRVRLFSHHIGRSKSFWFCNSAWAATTGGCAVPRYAPISTSVRSTFSVS